MSDLDRFVNGGSQIQGLPDNFRRYPNWQEHLSTGPFYRFSPHAKSRFTGKLGPLWPVFKPVFKLLGRLLFILKTDTRPCQAEWRGKKGDAELILRNVGPSIKDQFGEAPNTMDYIYSGLTDIVAKLEAGGPVTGLFIIDGGPRHKIVQEILKLEDRFEKFQPTIIVCDAWRRFYHEIFASRKEGRFIAGSNKTLKGDNVENGMSGAPAKFWAGGDKTGVELAQQELWFYSK